MWIQTISGKKFSFETLSTIDIKDIAWSLSHTCRYNGHTRKFYSVAEHSVLIAQAASDQNALAGLMHDASEAYTGDMPTPLKRYFRSINVHVFDQLEDEVQERIFEHFNILYPIPKEIKDLDRRILAVEAPLLLGDLQPGWGLEALEPLNVDLQFWKPEEAYQEFLSTFRILTNETLSSI